jgi:cardiolipin synthase
MGILEPYIAVIVFGRDIGMLLTAWIVYNLTNVRDFRPTLLGKANSFSQVVSIGVVLLSLIPDQAWESWGQEWILVARSFTMNTTLLLTVASGFHYALVASKRIGIAAAGNGENTPPSADERTKIQGPGD